MEPPHLPRQCSPARSSTNLRTSLPKHHTRLPSNQPRRGRLCKRRSDGRCSPFPAVQRSIQPSCLRVLQKILVSAKRVASTSHCFPCSSKWTRPNSQLPPNPPERQARKLRQVVALHLTAMTRHRFVVDVWVAVDSPPSGRSPAKQDLLSGGTGRH